MTIFHRNRRDLLSKTLFDIFKLTTIACCVSGFFPSFKTEIRLIILSIIVISFWAGFFICPEPTKEK